MLRGCSPFAMCRRMGAVPTFDGLHTYALGDTNQGEELQDHNVRIPLKKKAPLRHNEPLYKTCLLQRVASE